MNFLQTSLIVSAAVFALCGVAPQAEAATPSKNLTVSAVVTTACRLTQDHDHPDVASSICTNGSDFTDQALAIQVAVIKRTESAAVVIF